MDYSNTAKQILDKVGGKENIVNVSHCMTRLCLTLKDESIVHDEEIKEMKGVAGIMKKAGNPISVILDAISGSMSPVIPAIIGAGMIQVLNIILGWILPADNQTLQLLGVIGNTAFYFLPVLVAYSAGRQFGANPVLVTAVVAILIHPNFVALTGAEGGIHFLGLPVTSFDYSSSIIPAVCAVISIVLTFVVTWIMGFKDPETKNN